MSSKREKRPSRLAWFAMDVDAFLEDPRMQTLTNKEKGAWALMLIRSFRNQGTVITDAAIIAEQTGLSTKDAKVLIAKLLMNHLLEPYPDKPFLAHSHRLEKEYKRAHEAYEQYRIKGIKSAQKNGTANLKLVE